MPALFRFFLLLLVVLSAASCRPEAAQVPEQAPARHYVTDDLGTRMALPTQPQRILALAPSMTEMLFAVADTATIVGRTQVCDYPAAARRKPVVNSYPLDLEGLVVLRPQVVFTVEGITSQDDAARLRQLGIPVYFQRYGTVADVLRGLRDLGRLLGRSQVARHLTDSLAAELQQLAGSQPRQAGRPRVLAITWQDPIYVYGLNTLFTDKIHRAGGQNALRDTLAQPYPALTREYILRLNPDVLLGGRFGQLDSSFFRKYPELRRIRAYQTRQVFPVTGNLMERPGPRVVESVRELQRLLAQPPRQ